MRAYLAIFRLRLIASLQYRAAALAGLSTQFAWGFMQLLAFSVFYRTDPASFPMEFPQLVGYIWIQQAFLALFMIWFLENDIFEAISSGAVAYELVRPVDLYNRWFCQSLGNRIARALLRCFPVLLVAFMVPEPFRLMLPVSVLQFTLFLFSMLLCVGVVVALANLVYISTLYTLSPQGVRIITAVLADFLAGSLIPLPFFPVAFRKIVELLPFAAMQNVPLRIYTGNLRNEAAFKGIIL